MNAVNGTVNGIDSKVLKFLRDGEDREEFGRRCAEVAGRFGGLSREAVATLAHAARQGKLSVYLERLEVFHAARIARVASPQSMAIPGSTGYELAKDFLRESCKGL